MKFIDTLKALPPSRQLALAAATLGVVLAMVFLVQGAVKEPKSLLYSGLEPATSGEVIEELEKRGIPYELKGDSILIAQSKRDEVRYDRDERYGGTDGVKVHLKKGFAIDGFGDRDKLSNFEDIRGTIYKDKLIGSNAKNTIEAGDGNDVIKGLGGRDKIYGGIGRDKIDGGKGKDKLWGDRGADKFIFKGKFGDDTIKDFETDNKGEKIVLKKIGSIESFDDLMQNHISDVKGSAVIEDGNGNSITIEGITMSELAANDFLF